MKISRRLLLALCFLLFLALCPFGCYASDYITITPGSVEGQNVTAAANFINAMGDPSVAANIMTWLNSGKISWSPSDLQENGETDDSGNITINNGIIHHITGRLRGTPFDPQRDLESILSLARTLFHEKIHAHQSNWFKVWGNLPGKTNHEVQAWSVTIAAMSNWVEALTRQYVAIPKDDAVSRLDALKRLNRVVNNLLTYLGSFLENNCYGAASAPFTALQTALEQFRAMIDRDISRLETSTGPQQATSPQVGQLNQEQRKAAETALASAPYIPRDDECSFSLTGQGAAAGHIFDCEVVNNSSKSLSCTIPAGLVLGPSDPAYQAMILGEDTLCSVPPHSSALFPLSGFCLNHGKLPPPASLKAQADSGAPNESILDDLVTSRKKNPDGSVTETYGNGTRVTTYPDGTVRTERRDGSGISTASDGTKIQLLPGPMILVSRPGDPLSIPVHCNPVDLPTQEEKPLSTEAVTKPGFLPVGQYTFISVANRASAPQTVTVHFFDKRTSQITDWEYDDKGSLKSESYQNERGTTTLRYNMEYNERGEVVRSIETSPDGTRTVREVTGASSLDEKGKSIPDRRSNAVIRHSIEYNERGEVIRSIGTSSNSTRTATDTGSVTTVVRDNMVYNQYGQLVGFTTETVSQDGTRTVTRESGLEYNNQGQLIRSTSTSQDGSRSTREFDAETGSVVKQFEYSPATSQTTQVDPNTLRSVVTRETVPGKEVSWTPLVEHREVFGSARAIVNVGNRLSEKGKYARDIQDPETYKSGVIQRALWFFGNGVGQDALVKDMEKQLAKLPKESQPSKEEKERVISQIWKDVNLTIKEAGLQQ